MPEPGLGVVVDQYTRRCRGSMLKEGLVGSFEEELARQRAAARAPEEAREAAQRARDEAVEAARSEASAKAIALIPEVDEAVRALQAAGLRRVTGLVSETGRITAVTGFMNKPRVWIGKAKGWSISCSVSTDVPNDLGVAGTQWDLAFPGFLQVPLTGSSTFHSDDGPMTLERFARKGSVFAGFEFISGATGVSRSVDVQLEVADCFSGLIRVIAMALARSS